MPLRRLAKSAALAAAALLAAPASAAEITDVVDAFDTENENPFDFHVEPILRQSRERGVIAREAGCTDCDEPVTEFHRELDFERVRTQVDFDLQLGLSRNLELHVTLPVVLSDRTTLEYAGSVTEANSNIDPSDERIAGDLDPNVPDPYDGPTGTSTRTHFGTYRYFDVPDDGVRRSGFGDMVVGLAWAPFDDARRPHVATLRLGLDYVAPTGKPAEGSNTGVGHGTHELRLSIGASRRLREFAEPYFQFSYAQPFAAAAGLFAEDATTSETRAPGGRIDVLAGTEVVLYDDPASAQHYSWDLGLSFGYTLAGRDYSPLSDALSRSDCNGMSAADAGFAAAPGQPPGSGGTNGNAYDPDPTTVSPQNAACAWVVQQPSNVVDDSSDVRSDWTYAHDGITDIEGHARLGGRTRFNLQFSRYVELRVGVALEWTNPHLLTSADAGRDADGDDIVELDPAPDGELERNPFYNLTLDSVGRRLRVENALDVTWDIGAAIQF